MPAGSNCARITAGPTRSIVYLSQNYDSIGASAERRIQDGHVEVENAADAVDFYRTNSNYTPSDLQPLPRDLPAEAEAIIAAGQYRQVRYSVFRAMGELAARCYAEDSSKRAEWRKWFERMCARPTAPERKLDGPNLAASALHYSGNEETRALLESLQANDPAMRGAFSWASRDIEARLKQQP